MKKDPRLTRIDPNRSSIPNPYGIDVTLFANSMVPIDAASITECLKLLELKDTIERFVEVSPKSFNCTPEILKVALTPDFHKGKGIPVGTVLMTKGFIIPQAMGKDINCGMRLHRTSLTAEQVKDNREKLAQAFRHTFFEGGRDIPMTRDQREALFTNGIKGLLEATPTSMNEGIWSFFHDSDIAKDLNRISERGSLKANSTFGLHDFLGPKNRASRDSQIGSIGGGNHFVEIQYVKKIIHGTIAHALGLKEGMVTVMIHTGSLTIGHLCGNYLTDILKRIYPANLKHPENGIFPLPTGEQYQNEINQFWDALANAGNFAFANRLFLALMVKASLRKTVGRLEFPLVYDAPHNFVWRKNIDGHPCFLHRKGACPAGGMEEMRGSPFEYYGEPVMVPESMGASSYLLTGLGNRESCYSASHGAGRVLSRGKALKGNDVPFKEFMEKYAVITPVDLKNQQIRLRKDIVRQKLAEIKQEAPFAYKAVTPVIETLKNAKIATPVAEFEPLMTIKG